MIKLCRFWWVLAILVLVPIYLTAWSAPPPTPNPPPSPLKKCVDFNNLKVGTTYHVPARFAASGASIWVLPHQWSNNKWYSGGRAEVKKAVQAGGSGNEVFLGDVNLGFDFAPLECVTLRFRHSGGNVNLIANNNVGNNKDFEHLNVPGATVSVTYHSVDKRQGILKLSGKFPRFNFQEKWLISFAIGGQELFIDDVCPCR
jgi:hypothetical protein